MVCYIENVDFASYRLRHIQQNSQDYVEVNLHEAYFLHALTHVTAIGDFNVVILKRSRSSQSANNLLTFYKPTKEFTTDPQCNSLKRHRTHILLILSPILTLSGAKSKTYISLQPHLKSPQIRPARK